MEVFTTIADFRSARRKFHGTLGFVPTMGYLHDGHLALVARAASDNQATAVSIFVNPTQFGPTEDFAAYPRDPQRDLAMLQGAGVDFIFMPPVAEMYPVPMRTVVEVGPIATVLEGAHRPNHFRGVATVVAKLFHIVEPTRAYFGQKDAQQVAVIRQFVQDLDFPVQVIAVPTRRAPDGLALSSRNVYLTAEQRAAAPVLYRALHAAQAAYAQGERDADALREVLRATLTAEPLAAAEYVSIADAVSLEEVSGSISKPVLLSMAVRIGQTRLIDNITLGENPVTT
jgi:pantoate--beta-alanine ligase